MMFLFHWLLLPHEGDSLQVASCTRRSQNSFQGRWCWTSKEQYQWSVRPLALLVPSPCPMCCIMLPSITFRPLKGDSSNLRSTSPQTAAQKYHSPCSAHRTHSYVLWYTCPFLLPSFSSCIVSDHNCNIQLFFWGAGKYYFSPVWLFSVGCHKPTKKLNALVQSTDRFNGKSVL